MPQTLPTLVLVCAPCFTDLSKWRSCLLSNTRPDSRRRFRAWRSGVSERDDFMAWVGSRLKEAEVALHNGDAAPRLAIWSSKEPVSVLGAWRSAVGSEEVRNIFRQLENTFSDCTSYSHEVV